MHTAYGHLSADAKPSQAKPCGQLPPSHLHTSESPHGGEGAKAKPCCQARPTGSPCISRSHLNAYGHLYLSPSNPTPAGQFPPPYITMHFYAPSKCIWHVASEKQGSLCLNLAKGNVFSRHTYIHRKVRMGRRGAAPSPQPTTPTEAKRSLAAKLAPQGRHAFLEAI